MGSLLMFFLQLQDKFHSSSTAAILYAISITRMTSPMELSNSAKEISHNLPPIIPYTRMTPQHVIRVNASLYV
jgi:hypothetical protein